MPREPCFEDSPADLSSDFQTPFIDTQFTSTTTKLNVKMNCRRLHEDIYEGDGENASINVNDEFFNGSMTSVASLDSSCSDDEVVHDISTPYLNASLKLPSTCTLLSGSSISAAVYLVGTAHFSLDSQQDVRNSIQLLQPDALVLELCGSRKSVLLYDEEMLLRLAQDMSYAESMSIIKQEGVMQGIMQLIMQSMSAYLTKQLGMAPGGEFRVAYEEARLLSKPCCIGLGDRPIGITLRRAFGSMSLWQKLKLGFKILTSRDTISAEDVEKVKQKDLLESLLEEMAGEYPELTRVFLEERDFFLAASLRTAAINASSMFCGKQELPVVVGVVGMGHVAGITKIWPDESKLEDPALLREILTIPRQSRVSILVSVGIRLSFVGFAGYGVFRLVRKFC